MPIYTITAEDYFYPRSPCGERPDKSCGIHMNRKISIHALLAESDSFITSILHSFGISIHALLAESDPLKATKFNSFQNFYPRSPCGERPVFPCFIIIDVKISIHALLAESDNGGTHHEKSRTISIHALLAESDHPHKSNQFAGQYFYPRSPCGERRKNISRRCKCYGYFYPRSPCGERLRQNYECFKWIKFLSTLSLRRATRFAD